MRRVLTTIGLVLDVIGAVTLAVGLFRAPVPLTPGWLRSPADTAADRSYGTVGGLYLVAGFGLQIVASIDRSGDGSAWAAALTLVVGAPLAVALCHATRRLHLRRMNVYRKRS
jgi:hypothetical protein